MMTFARTADVFNDLPFVAGTPVLTKSTREIAK